MPKLPNLKLRILLLSACISFIMTSCVLKTTHEETIASYAEVVSELKTLRKQNEKISQDIELLKQRNSDLSLRNEELSQTNTMLVAKNKDLLTEQTQAQREFIRLKEDKLSDELRLTAITTTYETLLSHMKNEITSGNVQIAKNQEQVSINLAGKILFPSGTEKLEQQGKTVLAKLLPVLQEDTSRSIWVEGHTDNVTMTGALRNRFPSNWELSAARAADIVRHLVDQGIDPKRIAAVGFGSQRPVADNHSVDGRQKNRRIEIVVGTLR